MKKNKIVLISLLLCATLLAGCAEKTDAGQDVSTDTVVNTEENVAETPIEDAETPIENEPQETSEEAQSKAEKDPHAVALADGVYTAEFNTDSSMFRVSEACDGKGTLTVKDGEMTIHISLGSKKILNLFSGLAEDAAREGAELLMPTEDSVTYSDGLTEEVYGFDVPVPVLDEEFDLALIGTKGKWYDHRVSVSNPQPLTENEQSEQEEGSAESGELDSSADNGQGEGVDANSLVDGVYTVELTFEGGSGKASILSPTEIIVKEGKAVATLMWNSPNYDYMLVDGEKYLPINTEGDSVFEIPVSAFDEPLDVTGDTVAMSKPHEVDYTITFHSDTLKSAE